MKTTIFDDIVSGKMKSWQVWEDDEFLAFLTSFPNTPGFTVVIPRQNPGDYVFALDDEKYQRFMAAVKTVANLLERAFDTPINITSSSQVRPANRAELGQELWHRKAEQIFARACIPALGRKCAARQSVRGLRSIAA